MTATRNFQEFVQLMEDYTGFLARMCSDEGDKLAALSSRELPRIERSIAVSQANAKQLENYENRRMAAQQEAGLEGLSFRELIDLAPPHEQSRLWQLFSSFESSVAEIRFFNDKSMAVARDAMVELNPESVLPPKPGAAASNPYAKLRSQQDGQPGLLKGKA